MKINPFVKIVLIMALLSVQIFTAAEPKYLFKIATDAPDGSSWVVSIKKINEEIAKKTGGQVGITVYPGGVMGDQTTILKKIEIGQLNGSTLSTGGLGTIYKDFSVVGFPMIFKSYDEYDYILSKMSAFFEKEFEKRGYVLLAWTEVGLIYVYSKKPVNTLELLKKSKPILMKDDSISIHLFREIGVEPIPLQMSDVISSLETGKIDTIFSSHYGLIATQWFSKVKYMADFPLTLMIGAVAVDKKIFQSMPAAYQQDMKLLFKTQFDALNQKVRKDNASALEQLKKSGYITVLDVQDKDKKVFYDVCTKVSLKLTEKEYSRDLYMQLIKYVEEYRNKK